MAREIKIDLADGRYAVIRNFLKNRDRARIQRAAFIGKEFKMDDLNQENEISLSGEALIAIQEAQMEILLMDYNGERENPFEALMDSEFEEDYSKIMAETGKVFENANRNLEK